MHTPSSGTQQITGQQAAVKTQVIDRGGWSSWAKLAFVALAVMLITGLIAWSVTGGKKGATKSASVGGSVHHAADGGVASDDKSVVEATKPPTVALDLSPLNTSLNELNTTLGGMGNSIASKVGDKIKENNQAVIEKLDQLLAQQAKPDDSSSTTTGVNTDDIKIDGDSDKPPCDEEVAVPTIEDRVGALETWRTGVDKTLKRHGRQIRRINDRLGQLSGGQVTDLPGYKTAVATRSTIVHLKYDK